MSSVASMLGEETLHASGSEKERSFSCCSPLSWRLDGLEAGYVMCMQKKGSYREERPEKGGCWLVGLTCMRLEKEIDWIRPNSMVPLVDIWAVEMAFNVVGKGPLKG